MTIKASVKNSLLPDAPWEVLLPEPLATIGRQSGCSIVLSDPEKHVSRMHASIELRGGAYFLTVSSRINPVLVNGAPCEPGTSVELKDGAHLTIHPFELDLQVTPPAGAAALAPPAAMPSSAPPPAAMPGFMAPPAPQPPAMPFSGGSPAPAPVAARPAPAAPARADDPFSWLDDLSPKAAPASDPFGLGIAAPTPAAARPVQADAFRQAAPAPTGGGGLMDGLMGTAGPSGNGGAISLDATPAPVDPLALLGGAPSGASTFSGFGEPAGALTPGFGAPAAPQPANDFLGIGLGTSPGRAGGPLVDFGRPVAHDGSSNLDHVHDFNLPFQPPSGNWNTPAASTGLMADLPAAGTGLMAGLAAAPAPAQPPRAGAATPDALVAAFLQGMGSPGFAIPPGSEAAFMRQSGEIVRGCVEGIITLLLARSEVKKELRAGDRTMLAAHNNNPLKFMTGLDEALRFLFDPASANTGAFLPPARAMEDACSELVAHEMGLVAGMRAAVTAAIKRFDPAITEKAADKAGGLVLNRKAKLWEVHVDNYAAIQRDMADNLDRLIEGDFLAAYSEQVWRMQEKG